MNWTPSVVASALNLAKHQACSLAAKEPLEAITESADRLHQLAQRRSPGQALLAWNDLVVEAGKAASLKDAATNWLSDASSEISFVDQAMVSAAASSLEGILTAYNIANPQAANQLRLRINPLIQAWDGYGNGMVAHFYRMTRLPKIVKSIDALAVQPVLGGDAFASLPANGVVVEAVLTNVIPEIPEVVRVMWAVSQLLTVQKSEDLAMRANASDSAILPQPQSTDKIRQRVVDVTSLALIPAALAAAEAVELSRCDEPNVQLALDQFAPRRPDHTNLATKLIHWWETFLQTRPDWEVAIVALGRALT